LAALLKKAVITVTPTQVTSSSPEVVALIGEVAEYVKPAPRAVAPQRTGTSTGANAQRKRAARSGGARSDGPRSGGQRAGSDRTAHDRSRHERSGHEGSSRPGTSPRNGGDGSQRTASRPAGQRRRVQSKPR
jgi:hypothetical protein